MSSSKTTPPKSDFSQRLTTLIKANQSLAHIESFEDLSTRLITLAKEVIQSEAASLMLYNKDQALEIVDRFINKKAVWAIKIGLEIKKDERDKHNDFTARMDIDEH